MTIIKEIPAQDWQNEFNLAMQKTALNDLEKGCVLYFPKLQFQLTKKERNVLNERCLAKGKKNISYHPNYRKLGGCNYQGQAHDTLYNIMARYQQATLSLLQGLMPQYNKYIEIGRTSYRPAEICHRKTSYRKDDKRLHIDAFTSSPVQGKRILRLFCNINPDNTPRVWNLGEPFSKVASRFMPSIKKPLIFSADILKLLKITKSKRSAYDHYMLSMHDSMKKDQIYQAQVVKTQFAFPAQTSWMVYTDLVSHAALSGCHLLEQTFYLDVDKMQTPSAAPLRILEQLTNMRLI